MMRYWKVRLTTYSPTFVGSGEKCKKDNYIYDRQNQTVRFLKEENWISFLASHDIMDDFAKALVSDGKKFDLFGYLKNQSVLKRKYGTVWNVLRAMKKVGAIDREVDYYSLKAEAPGDINAQIRDAEGNPYIPGSSLKGAFRTAILSHEIRKNPSRYRSTWAELERAAGDEWKMGNIVGGLEKEMGLADGKEMVKSYFRGLTVSDAVWVEGDTCVVAKADLTIEDEKPHQVSLYRECLDTDAELEFTIGIDDSEAGMGHYGIKNFSDLQKVLRQFVDFQYEILQSPFRKNGEAELRDIKNHQNADLLLGGGTGFLTKTLLYSLAPDRRQAVYVTRKLMEKMFRKHYHNEDRDISPHTMKLVSMDGETCLMGLCYLEEVKELC